MATPAWITALASSVVKTDLTADAADGVLTYTEALQLMTAVKNAGAVTSAEFTGLQALAANLNNGLAGSAYIYSIVNQLVDGSPANAKWVAGGPIASATTMGNLAVSSTATQMDHLIGQWFLGTNLPDPAPPSGPTYSYSMVTAPLYGPTGAAAVNDICQGADGDCEVMTGLILLADNHPQQLAQMFVANPNGTYGVRFYINGNQVWETVNTQLPTQGGELVYAHDPNFNNTALWVALAEKAYAQLSATGKIGHPAGVDSYDNINANAAVNILPAMIDAANVSYHFGSDANFVADKILYIDAVASGDDVMVETGNAADTYDAHGNIELVGGHAFAVTGYDAATGDFIVRNPWGNSFVGQNWDTTFEVSLSGIAGVKGDFAIDDTGHGGSTMTLLTESAQILATVANSITGLVRIDNTTGAAPTLYNLQVVGGGTLSLNGAVNHATAAQTALGQIVVSASDLSKVKLGGATGTQSPSLLVSVFDGKAWSAFANIQLGVSTVGATFNPVLDLVVAAGATVKVTSLFKVAGTVSSSGGFYEIDLPNGDGTINLNGATNYFGSQSPGATLYDISSAQLGLLTYTAPAAGGTVTLQGTVYTGSAWTPWQNFELNIGVTVATALRDYANGQLGTAGTVADTAANVFANLNAMQSAFSSGNLTSIEVTNTTLQHEVLGHKQYTADHGLLSMLQGKVVVSQYDARDNVLNGGVSDLLLVNASGAFDTGQVGSTGTVAYHSFATLGTTWKYAATGDFLADGHDQFLVANASGGVDIGQVGANQTATLTSFTTLSGWNIVGAGDFLGKGHDQFLVQNSSGALETGDYVGGQVVLHSFAQPGTGWKVIGAGDFLGEGHDQFLIENASNAVEIGDGPSGAATLKGFTSIPGWTFLGVGDFKGEGHDQFLMENASGTVDIGDVVGGALVYHGFTSLVGWTLVATGDYLGEGHDQFLLENASGTIDIGDDINGVVHLAQLSAISTQWMFHG